MAPIDTDAKKVAVRTTLPRLPLPAPPTIRTARLLLRPLTRDDLGAFHGLRAQPAFMAESTLGKPDADVAETQAALDDLARPGAEHLVFGLFLADTGELIGDGGVHTVRGSGLGWPEVGYKLHPAHWGRGLATEAMRAVLAAWWALPREAAELEVHPASLPAAAEEAGEGEGEKKKKTAPAPVGERMVAEIAAYNGGSRRVLEKLGFEDFGSWEEPDTQLHRLGQPLMMGHYVLSGPP
ncbi:acetyltransferase domain-containing protein [Xylaria palmicola]|nr:acetyltransferase domain-containing protein [Xylaria palmicola]